MRNLIIRELVEAVAELAGDGYVINQNEVSKNNGVVLQAIVIQEDGGEVSPSVYIDEIAGQIENGTKTIDEAAEEIFEIYQKNKMPASGAGISKIVEREYILHHAMYQIVNAERNAERLVDIPHRYIEDLAVIYRASVDIGGNGIGSYVISNEIMENIGLSLEELEKAANENTAKAGFEIKTLAEIIGETTGHKTTAYYGPRPYVMTNKSRVNGASILLFPDQLALVANRMHEDFYILPSSIHELLAVPASSADCRELVRMVREVNETQVLPEEVLGYAVYRYDSKTGEVRVVA